MKFPGHSRTQLPKEQAEDLEHWMSSSEAEPAIAFRIPKYLLMQNTKALLASVNLPQCLKGFAAE